MKKQFRLMALASAAMLFAACSQDNLLSPQEQLAKAPENNVIQFGTYLGKTAETRSTFGKTGAITTDVLKTGATAIDGFGVFAYYTNTTAWTDDQTTFNANFMYNQQVTANGSSNWTYSPLKYWPNDFATTDVDNQTLNPATGSKAGGKVSFFAYAPYVASAGTASDDGIIGITANTAQEAPKITYKLPANPSESNIVDLLWGMRGGAYNQAPSGSETGSATGYNTDLTKQTVTEKVNFLFKHALARLGGSATTGNHGGIWVALDLDHVRPSTENTGTDTKADATLVTVKSIKIENGETSPFSFNQQGVFNLATGQWSNLTVDYTISDEVKHDDASTKLNNAIAEPTSGLANDGSGWKVSSTSLEGVTTALKQMYTGKDSYYLIPSTTDQKLKITITYVVRTYDDKLSNNGKSWSEVEQTISKIVTFTGGLDSNKIYRLNLYLGLTSVKFTATVSNWSPADGSGYEGEELREVDLPINVADV
jgi:hypothetical protein